MSGTGVKPCKRCVGAGNPAYILREPALLTTGPSLQPANLFCFVLRLSVNLWCFKRNWTPDPSFNHFDNPSRKKLDSKFKASLALWDAVWETKQQHPQSHHWQDSHPLASSIMSWKRSHVGHQILLLTLSVKSCQFSPGVPHLPYNHPKPPPSTMYTKNGSFWFIHSWRSDPFKASPFVCTLIPLPSPILFKRACETFVVQCSILLNLQHPPPPPREKLHLGENPWLCLPPTLHPDRGT